MEHPLVRKLSVDVGEVDANFATVLTNTVKLRYKLDTPVTADKRGHIQASSQLAVWTFNVGHDVG
jgi:hypothetical protein